MRGGNRGHSQRDVVGLGLVDSLLVRCVERRSIGPAVLGVRRIVKGEDGVDVSVGEQERLERYVFVGFTSVYECEIPETRDRTGLGMPVVERVWVHSDVVFRLADGAEYTLNCISDDRARVGIAELQEGLIEQGTGRSGNKAEGTM